MGGTAQRMLECAKFIGEKIGCYLPVGSGLIDITASSQRYSMYKVGPVLTINVSYVLSSSNKFINILINDISKIKHL